MTTRAPVRVRYLLPNVGVGGAETALLVIARHARDVGIDVAVTALGPPRRPIEETVLPALADVGVSVECLGLVARPTRSSVALVVGARRFRCVLRERQVDVVDSCLLDADLTARIALLGSRIAHVVHLVNTPYDDNVRKWGSARSPWRLTAARRLDSLTAGLTDSFIALTRAVAERDAADLRLPAHRVVVISRGVELDRFVPKPVYEGPFTSQRPFRLVSIGRLVPQKGHSVALAAVAELSRREIPVHLTVTGEGPLESELVRQRDDLGLRREVQFTGVLTDVRPALAACDAFLFPSLWEGQGNALLEAMAAGRPVIASAVAAVREVVGEAGLLAPPGDALALADVVTHAVNRTPVERRRAAEAVRRIVVSRFDAQDRVGELADHYRRLIARERRRR